MQELIDNTFVVKFTVIYLCTFVRSGIISNHFQFFASCLLPSYFLLTFIFAIIIFSNDNHHGFSSTHLILTTSLQVTFLLSAVTQILPRAHVAPFQHFSFTLSPLFVSSTSIFPQLILRNPLFLFLFSFLCIFLRNPNRIGLRIQKRNSLLTGYGIARNAEER